jgi:hypothetical protein
MLFFDYNTFKLIKQGKKRMIARSQIKIKFFTDDHRHAQICDHLFLFICANLCTNIIIYLLFYPEFL